MSHLKAWTTFLESGFEYAIIFEDDVSFDPKVLRQTIDEMIQNKSIWDICSFDVLFEKPYLKVRKLSSGRDVVHYLFQTAGAAAYLINRKAAIALVERVYPIKMTPDDYYTRSWEFGIRFVGVEPRIVKQTYGVSDVVAANNIDRKVRIPEPLTITIKRRVYYHQKQMICALYSIKNWLTAK
jgi:glycosyl transferase family 25